MAGLPWAEIGLVAIVLLLTVGGVAFAYGVGKKNGRDEHARQMAELAGKQQEALQKRIDKTKRPATPEDALERM